MTHRDAPLGNLPTEELALLTPGEKLRRALKEKGLTQQGLAEKLGTDRETVNKWVNNAGRRPSEKHAKGIAAATGYPAEWFRPAPTPRLGLEERAEQLLLRYERIAARMEEALDDAQA